MRLLFLAVLTSALAACATGPAPAAPSSPSTAIVTAAPPTPGALTAPSAPAATDVAIVTGVPPTPALAATIAAAVAATQTALATTTAASPPPPPMPTPAAPAGPATAPPAPTAPPTATRPPAPRPATAAPIPTSAPTPVPPLATFEPVSQTLWLADASSAGEGTTVEIILTNARVWPGDQYQRPEPDHVFLIVEVEVRNRGPASLRGVNGFDFLMLDDDRAIHQPRLLRPTNDCPPRLVELLPGGRLRACFGYQVLASGPVEFIYAPRRAAGLRSGTYLSFPLRPA